jgi:hypothetical protein
VTVAVGVEVTVAVGVEVTVAVAVSVTVCVGCGFAAEVWLFPSEGVVPELPAEAEAVTVTEPLTVTDGENTVGAVVDDPEVHAASVIGASRVSPPQHRTVSFPRSVVPRTFMDPPHAPGR